MSDHRKSSRTSTQTSQKAAEQPNVGKRGNEPDTLTVSSTWLAPVAVNDRELEILELYLGDALDALLSNARRPRARGPPS